MKGSRSKGKGTQGKQGPAKTGGSRPGRAGQNKGKSPRRNEEGGSPKLVRAKGRFVAGIHAVKEVLRVRPHEVNAIYFKHDYERVFELKQISETCDHHDLEIQVKKDSFFNSVCATHQGVVVDVSGRPQLDESVLDEPGSSVIILDEIEDPHNLGAILRSAWLLGFKALFITDKRSATLTATAAKVACGGAEHVPVIVEKSFQVLLKDLKEKGFWIYGLAGEADSGLWDVEFPEKTALVVGSEAKGMRSSTRAFCDQILSIPQTQADASLNASVASAIAMAEVRRQWKK